MLKSSFVSMLTMFLLAQLAAADPPKTPSDTQMREQLAVGYSLLYQEAVGIPKMDWLLSFKNKTPEMKTATESLMDYYKDLASRMEKLSKQYPAVKLDAKALPDIEAEARKSMGADQAKDFAPLIGKSGSKLEREALITFRSALDEQRHLASAMRDEEPVVPLKRFLETTKTQLDEQYKKIDALLQQRYFTH